MITLPELLNVREGPGTNYDVVTIVPEGTEGVVIGIGPDYEWYQVEIEDVEGEVWVYQPLTRLVGTLVGIKEFSQFEIAFLLGPGGDGTRPLAITLPITMNVRSGPGLTYDVQIVVPADTQGYILGIDPTNDWFQIDLPDLYPLSWVYQDLTRVVGSLDGVRLLTLDEIAMLPAAITQPLLLNAREGPGLDYDIVATVPRGTWTRITGVDELAKWYRVELDNLVTPAWIMRDYTRVAGGSLGGLIQIASVPRPQIASVQSLRIASVQPLAPAVAELTGSITVNLSLPPAGGADFLVSWTDLGVCNQLYNIYHRSSADSSTYVSLETATTATTPDSKNLRFSTYTGTSFVSAWCGTVADGREVAEVEINPSVAGAYSSPSTGGTVAWSPPPPAGSDR